MTSWRLLPSVVVIQVVQAPPRWGFGSFREFAATVDTVARNLALPFPATPMATFAECSAGFTSEDVGKKLLPVSVCLCFPLMTPQDGFCQQESRFVFQFSHLRNPTQDTSLFMGQILSMQAGFALLEAGSVRSSNSINVMCKVWIPSRCCPLL